jgi:hypothetical protein
MENVNQIKSVVEQLKDTISNAVADIKIRIADNLSLLSSVKGNLATAYNELESIADLTTDLAISMDVVADETAESVGTLGDVLAIIDPDNFGIEEEDFDDYDEEEDATIVVEDTESGEETEIVVE